MLVASLTAVTGSLGALEQVTYIFGVLVFVSIKLEKLPILFIGLL